LGVNIRGSANKVCSTSPAKRKSFPRAL